MTESSRFDKLLEAKRSYREKPTLRRDKTCESILGCASGGLLIVIFIVARLARLTDDDTSRFALLIVTAVAFFAFVASVLLVCIIVLTGPVYTRQLDFSRGELETWGIAQKSAAVIISVLVLSGAAFLAKWFFF